MKTKRFGLIGKNIDYSFSRGYFTEKFSKLKLDCSYENFDVESLQLFADLISESHDIKGFNVTIPYKESIIPYLDSLSTKAKKIGAVNTIRIDRKGNLKGYNTDWYGFYYSLKPLLKYSHKRALILGTGGASKAVEYALKKLGIKYQFVSRTKHDDSLTYEELTSKHLERHTIIINTTPVGTFPDIEEMPEIPVEWLTAKHIVFDLIYNPEETKLMREAAKRGAITKNGYEMLVLQAEKAWTIWNKTFVSD
ncbi:MAG: shikimate dehydrogenase [Flavobacteriaceae bacterium]|jgi:shikimate dehydrogenase|nr:shikimate dehydrogenase [Flavobacteriaceae bacterium]